MVLDIGMEENMITDVEMDQVVINGEILDLVKVIVTDMEETIKIQLNGKMMQAVIIINKMVQEQLELLRQDRTAALHGKVVSTQKELQVCALTIHA